MDKGIWVKVRKFIDYKGRKDVPRCSWFRCSNRILEDADFFEFTHGEMIVWFYILALASQKNSDTIFISFAHADRVCRLKKSVIQSAVKKLMGNQIDPVDVSGALRDRHEPDTAKSSTDRQTDIQTDTAAGANSSPPPRSMSDPVKFSSLNDLLGAFDEGTRQTWAELYANDEYRHRQATKAWDYYRTNPQKLPKNLKGWKRALNHWFEADWSKHVRGIPASKASVSGICGVLDV